MRLGPKPSDSALSLICPSCTQASEGPKGRVAVLQSSQPGLSMDIIGSREGEATFTIEDRTHTATLEAVQVLAVSFFHNSKAVVISRSCSVVKAGAL